ncbi:copper amine oxidase N-terminal domain-containing protein [Cohnella faecalis]|uniref:Copper amine oxidase N-terminal domain-containing protein n=2 Tax=Cohnella faecalis TaxID=2315694 RepID=A0A398CFX6_9BACL|nr:copper amine oxidase N-terminal domain-containing protein [Cohnella faecalis]
MKMAGWKSALAALVLCFAITGSTSAFAEEADGSGGEGDEAVEQTAESFFEGLEEMEYNELTFQVIRTDVVKGNDKIPEAHFRSIVLFQNTSPYTIQTPATAFELFDKGFNQVALTNVRFEGVKLLPGDSKWIATEYESLAEVTEGQSTKGLKAGMYNSLYGERVEDSSEITAKGVYVFVNSKPLKVKVADPLGTQYVPAKNLLEAMGYKFVWNAKTSTFTATKGQLKVEQKIGSRQMKINGKIVKVDAGATAFVNKAPMISLYLVPTISSTWTVSRGIHDDITILSIVDRTLIK